MKKYELSILSQLILNITKLQERESNDKLKKERDSLQNFLTEKEKRIEQYFQIIKDLEQQKNKVSWHLCTNVHLSLRVKKYQILFMFTEDAYCCCSLVSLFVCLSCLPTSGSTVGGEDPTQDCYEGS